MLSTQQGKNLVYELTMEYVKRNNMLDCSKEALPTAIKKIADVSNIISDAVEKNYHDFKFL